MSAARTTKKDVIRKFPQTAPSSVVIGDSQTKYLFEHFDPLCVGTPAFVSQPGACISDARLLIDSIPACSNTVFLHVGTNDLTSSSAERAFCDYRSLTDLILQSRPNVSTIYASLILPRSANRRRDYRISRFAIGCNEKARRFNSLLREFCRHSRCVRFIDHGFQHLPARRVLAADGLHPSFEGVAVLASHIRELCFTQKRCNPPGWREVACTAAQARAGASYDHDFPPLPLLPSSPTSSTTSPDTRSNRPAPCAAVTTVATDLQLSARDPHPESPDVRRSLQPVRAPATTASEHRRIACSPTPRVRRAKSLPRPPSGTTTPTGASTTTEPLRNASSGSALLSDAPKPAYNLRKKVSSAPTK